ncbi:phospholipase D-like domain-containing anti-phage protein [Marinobacter sp.]|uniref:phospholipase D-like domain-containing anti-phage protein n=3 Tax=Marinobacter TaxID=2742 RepID=UPI00235575A8
MSLYPMSMTSGTQSSGITRLSSRTHALDESFLTKYLEGATRYRRIAGYFTSSMFEVAGEAIMNIPRVEIVCNADVQPEDLRVAKVAQAKLMGKWNEHSDLETDALFNRKRYQQLADFLTRGHTIKVAPSSNCGFVHGKAGIIDLADGRKIGFIGSMNETSSGWRHHYEILWADESPEGVAWIEAEFDYLWRNSAFLPDAVTNEIRRRTKRHEVSLPEIEKPEQVAPAALVESPMYREGFTLQPWQQGFVTETLKHYRAYGVVRLLLADEVGLGKTLSMATAALTLSLLEEQEGKARPTVIFAPATLCEQWQTELIDKLGIPTARWSTLHKGWLNSQGMLISGTGTHNITECPLRIGIISTGLMVRDSDEKQRLLDRRGEYGLVVLDEAHKARTMVAPGSAPDKDNKLLSFMKKIAGQAKHVILGTATPIQTRREDLWDAMRILHQGKGRFVLGEGLSRWHHPSEVVDLLSGVAHIGQAEKAWAFVKTPLPPVEATNEPKARQLYNLIRSELGLSEDTFYCDPPLVTLDEDIQDVLQDALDEEVNGASFFQRENPFVRHIVLRKRSSLENAGLLPRIAVDIHPDIARVGDEHGFRGLFDGIGLRVDDDYRVAYEAAQDFGKALASRGRGSGFMKNLMEQRICSSIHAGISTARKLLEGDVIADEEDEQEAFAQIDTGSGAEIEALETLIARLGEVREDPKLNAIQFYLDSEGWLALGCIVFSQYYDTAAWVARSLAARYPDEPIGLYAGAGKSRLFLDGNSVSAERENLKLMVAERKIRLMIATDAACEGLNLQTLGTLINVDLPWNPTKLEQRIGRIKRFGQTRDRVDMLNLVNHGTVDERVYERLSERMRDRFDLFGALPDTIKDEWIDNIEDLGEEMDKYIDAQKRETGFDIRYNATLEPDDDTWSECSKVLSRRDFRDLMSRSWNGKRSTTDQSQSELI